MTITINLTPEEYTALTAAARAAGFADVQSFALSAIMNFQQ